MEGDWSFWQKVIIVMLTIIVVVLGYRKLLRTLGGNSRFDDRFAFLHPLVHSNGLLVIQFELPEEDSVSLLVLDQHQVEVGKLLNQESLSPGNHRYEISTSEWQQQRYTVQLKSGNQRIERFFEYRS